MKVPSLVFDLELEDGGVGSAYINDDADEDETVMEIARFVAPTNPAESRLMSDVKVAAQHARDGADTARLVAILQALGYRCVLRTALGGGDGADCLRNLRHTFIESELPAGHGSGSRRYIIDPLFKEQFIIAKATPRYAAILAAIPQVFVGPEEHLSLLVNFLCTEMAAAFRQLGSVLPPWRQASSMLSKWKPRKSVDEAGPGASGRAASGGSSGGVGVVAGGGAGPWPAKPASRPMANPFADPCAQPSLHHWQQAAQLAAQDAPGRDRRPSWEPAKVVFGGNFIPITPAHAS